MLRRVLAASLALAGVLAAVPADAAPKHRLDGARAKSFEYEGTLTSPHVPANGDLGDPLAPSQAGCTEYSCDLRELQLVLPKNTTWGKFHATVLVPAELNAALVLYDAKKNVVWMDELWREPVARQTPCCEGGHYRLSIYHRMLRGGTYTLGVIDRAGVGSFAASVQWDAHPPDRLHA